MPERRPGFGVLKRVLREAFGIGARFDVTAEDDAILDLVCMAHFRGLGTDRAGGWKRMSFQALAKFHTDETKLKASKATMESRVYTALGYESTRKHPVYGGRGS